jgi:hypothetical protein
MTGRHDLDRYLDDFARQLSDSTTARPPRRAGRRRLVLIAVAAVAAVGVAGSLLGGSGERLDPVAEAQAALDPSGEIVYMQITSTFLASKHTGVPKPQTTELWSALGPPRWRFVQTLPSSRAGQGVAYDARGPITGRQELSYADGVQRSYIADRDTLTVDRGYSDDGPAARVPLLLLTASGDVQTDLRSMLADGDVTDLGERQVGGRTVRRLVSTQRSQLGSGASTAKPARGRPQLVRELVYDVDPQTFAPIQATLTITLPSHPRAVRLSTRMRFDAYERIPLTATTAKLLRIQTTARTKVVVHTAAERRAREQRFRNSCHRLKSGGLACTASGIEPPKVPAG